MRVRLLFRLVSMALGLTGVARAMAVPPADSVRRDERPTRPKLVVETDQRFTFFNDSRTLQNRLEPINMWGARVGLLMPSNWKFGIGAYYSNQNIRRTDLLDDLDARTRRHMYFLTAYAEPFWTRRKLWEFSTPIELGYGRSRYDLITDENEVWVKSVRRGWFVPLGVGASASVKFPPIGRFKPTRWFGLNFLVGYRFILGGDFPQGRSNYNGAYASVGPIFFLDRFTDDWKHWRKRRKSR